jgi:ribosomal protein L11 methyltransferase
VSPSEPRYWFVAADVAPEDVDEASLLLFELGAQGVEERDQATLVRGAEGRSTLVASFAGEQEARAALPELTASWNARLEVVVGDAWRDEYKKYFHPFVLCDGIVVRPPWEERAAEPGETVLVLEPGRAFGTGLHETTALVSESLAAHRGRVSGADVLDVGCGSGILGLVALAFGAERVRATDVDPDAVAVTQENAALNGVSQRISADTADVAVLAGAWPLVLANIEARVLVPMAPALAAKVAPGGLLVVSGILVPQETDVRRAYEAEGLDHRATRARGEWVAIEFERRAQ